MARYTIDGRIFDTERAAQHWDEDTFFDGRNRISRATGDQFLHQRLYLSSKGTYWLENTSQWQGSRNSAETITPEEAAHWLLTNNHPLPESLSQHEAAMCE